MLRGCSWPPPDTARTGRCSCSTFRPCRTAVWPSSRRVGGHLQKPGWHFVTHAAASQSHEAAVETSTRTTATATSISSPTADAPGSTPEWVEVGLLRSSHGVRGEIKVQPLTDFPQERLGKPGIRWLQAPAKQLQRGAAPQHPNAIDLQSGRPSLLKGREVWLVKLAGYDSPEAVEELKGYTLLIRSEDREELEDEDEFYAQDLVGMAVVLQATSERVGKVIDIYSGTGTHDVLRIQLAKRAEDGSKQTALMPFAKAFVPFVDTQLRVMEITPPEGLLEATAQVQKRKRRKEGAAKPQPKSMLATSVGCENC